MRRREKYLHIRPWGVDEMLCVNELFHHGGTFFGKTVSPLLKKAPYELNRKPGESTGKFVQCSSSCSTSSEDKKYPGDVAPFCMEYVEGGLLFRGTKV